MLNLFKIAGEIQLDGMDKVDKQLDRADKKASGLGSKLGKTAKKVGKFGAIAGGALAGVGAAAFAMTEKVTGALDDISKGASRLGVTTDFYQEMDFWASQNGMSHERMEKAVGRFNQRLGQAVNGNEKYSDALGAIGVNLDDVRDGTLSTEDAFAQSIKTLSEMESEQDKVNYATEIFGTRMARDMLPALADGALSIDEARKKAQELGIVMGEDALDQSVKFQDTWDRLKRTFTTVGRSIMVELMPMFQKIMDWTLQNLPAIKQGFSTAFGVVKDVIMTVVDGVKVAISWFKSWYQSNYEVINGIKTTIMTVFNEVREYIMTLWNGIKDFFQQNGEGILQNAQTIFQSYYETVKTIYEQVWQTIKTVLELIRPFIKEQLERIKKFWDENGEQIMQAVQNTFAIIQGIIETVMGVVRWIIETVWGNIEGIIDGAVGVILGIVEFLASVLTGDFEGMKESLSSIWDSLWQIIEETVDGAWNLLSGAFAFLWEQISGWFTGLKDDAIDWGKDLIVGFWEGIKGMGGWLGKKISGLITDVVPGPVKKVLGIASPSRLMMEYGEDTGEGLKIGLQNKGRELQQTAEQMARTVEGGVNASLNIGQARQPMQNTNNQTTNNYQDMFRGMLEGANFNVRNDHDIEDIAQRLANHIKSGQRSKGVVVR